MAAATLMHHFMYSSSFFALTSTPFFAADCLYNSFNFFFLSRRRQSIESSRSGVFCSSRIGAEESAQAGGGSFRHRTHCQSTTTDCQSSGL